MTPPDASSVARPATCATAARSSSGDMLSSSSDVAPAASASSTSAIDRHSTSSASSGASSRARRTAAPTPPARAAWFSLIRIASYRPARWLVAPPAATAAFSSVPQPGRRLAGVEDHRSAGSDRLRHGPDAAGGHRRHARQPLQEVQRGPLARQQRPSAAGHARHLAALAPDALVHQRLECDRPDRATRTRAAAGSRPKITPGAFCVISAVARASGATVAAVVTSPEPTSSASALATVSAIASISATTIVSSARRPGTSQTMTGSATRYVLPGGTRGHGADRCPGTISRGESDACTERQRSP